jgi:hypothetical protein
MKDGRKKEDCREGETKATQKKQTKKREKRGRDINKFVVKNVISEGNTALWSKSEIVP